MWKRIGTGILFFLVFLAGVHIKWLWWLMPCIIVIAGLLGVAEFVALAGKKGVRAPLLLSMIIALLIFAGAFSGSLDNLPAIFSLSLCILLIYFALVGDLKDSIRSASVVLMASVYVALPLGITLALFRLSTPESQGLPLLVFIVVVAWSTDTGAYGFGGAFGKRKIAPVLSPNKTVEGCIGGFLSGIVVALLMVACWKTLRTMIPWQHAFFLGALIGFFSQVGDLAESAFKRDAGVKDSGNTIMGHGGILDVIDSLLLIFPLSYLYLHFILKLL